MLVSANEGLTRSVAAVQMLTYQYKFRVWYEFVPSAQNWADGVSRPGAADPWVQKCAFPVTQGAVPLWPWQGTLRDCRLALASGSLVALGGST